MNTSKKRGPLLLLLALLVLGGGAWWFFAGSKDTGQRGETANGMVSKAGHEAKQAAVKMTMKVASMSITGIDNNRIQVVNKVILNNPLPAPLTLNRIDYKVTADGIPVAEGAYTKPVRIPALSDTVLSLPMQVLVKGMDKVNDAAKRSGRDTAVYMFYNTVHTDVPLAGNTKIPFNVREELPVVWAPTIKPGDIDLNDFGLKNSAMGMTLHVTNPNPFTIRMLNGRYTMAIDGKETIKGAMEKVVVLPAESTVPVQMHLDMKTGKALKTGWKMLFDQKETKYRLTFDSDIASDRKMLEKSTMHFVDEGNLKDLKEELKKQDEQ